MGARLSRSSPSPLATAVAEDDRRLGSPADDSMTRFFLGSTNRGLAPPPSPSPLLPRDLNDGNVDSRSRSRSRLEDDEEEVEEEEEEGEGADPEEL
jgi:hypothetical protein